MFPDRRDLLEAGHVLREWEEDTHGVRAVALTWPAILEQWKMIETDFQVLYHIDLAKTWGSWRWFETRLGRILADRDTMLGRWAQDTGEQLTAP